MANPHKGELAFKHGEKTFTMSFSINALCELEDQLAAPMADIMTKATDPASMSIKTIRAVFWAGLRDHHPDLTTKDAGDLMTAMGQLQALELVGRAITLAFPEAVGPLASKVKVPTG